VIKKALGTGKVGHAGTLDKFAEGLLIVLTGRCTKLIPWFEHCDKTYTGIVRFGIETDTLDPEGEIVKKCAIPSQEDIEKVIPQFLGKIMQAPPLYSAIHIDGKRAYELARDGKSPEMKKRPIDIYDLRLETYENGEALIHVDCSKGTYIRSLARDLAYAADSCAHLVYLNRTSIAGFSLSDAINLSTEIDPHEAIRNAIKPVNKKMFEALHIPFITVDDKTAHAFINGKPLQQIIDTLEAALDCIENHTENTNLAIFREDERFVGIIQKQNDCWKYGYMYANN
jgi:tRNA pseudouridine55 synthase